MFGRILIVEVFDKEGNSTYLVDPLQKTRLMCSGIIEYLPTSSGAPRATIQVYNIPATLAQSIFALQKYVNDAVVDDPKFIRVQFGYEDENNGELRDIFIGRIARAFTTREDTLTTVTKIYAYQLSDFYTSGVSSAQFDAGTSVYELVESLFKNSTVPNTSVQIPEALKNMFIDTPLSFYGKTVDCVNSVLENKQVNYMLSPSALGLSIVPMSVSQHEIDAIILGKYEDDGKVHACNGLIGFPCIDTQGMRFETLINPLITLYSYVWLPNSVIIDNRDGFPGEIQSTFGATYDPAGLYRVTKMTTRFDSHTGDCKTSYLAVAAGVSSAYYR